MIADEDNLTWTFLDSFDCEETVELGNTMTGDYVVVLSDDTFFVQEVPKLIEALQAAYNFHMEHKESV